MSSCVIFPEIYNSKGELVDSQLFKDALLATNSREEAKKVFSEARSHSFLQENGNWLLYKDLNSGRVSVLNKFISEEEANNAVQRYQNLYGSDYVYETIGELQSGPIKYYTVKLKEVSAGDIKLPLDVNGEPLYNKIQFQRRQSQEEKFFRNIVGLNKNTGNSNYRAKINKAVDNFNKKYGTSHYVNWKQMGQSDLFKIEDITWRWNDFGSSQTTLFQKEENKSVEDLTDVLNLINQQVPVDYEEISEQDAASLLEGRYNGEPAFFYKGKVYLVKGKATLESTFHEFSHPIINQLYITNRTLFDNLYNQMASTPEGKEIIGLVNSLYPENSAEDNRKEALVMFLGKMGEANYKKSKEAQSVLSKIISAIKRFLNKVFNNKVNLDKLSVNTTLQEFSEMIGVKGTKQINLSPVLSSANKVEFQKIPITSDLRKVIDKTEATISNQIAIYKAKSAQNSSKSEGLSTLESVLEKVKQVSDGLEYLEAINSLLPILNNTEEKLHKLAEKGTFSKKDASFLKSTEEFLSSLVFLDDLAVILKRKKIELDPTDEFANILNNAIIQKQSLQTVYNELSLDYLSELLFNEIDPTIIEDSKVKKEQMLKVNPNNSRAKIIITSKEDMRNHLQEASKDIKAQNLWLYSAASSNDPALSLGALYIKRNLEQAADDTYLVAQRMNLALEAFKLTNKSNIDDPRKFNEDIIEEIDDILYVKNEQTGETEPQIIRRLAFVGEFDITTFNRSYLLMKAKQSQASSDEEAKKIFKTWVEQNVEFKSNWQEIIEAKAAKYGGKDSQGFKDWESDNLFYFKDQFGNIIKTVPKFGKELWQPKRELYTNPNYTKLLNKADALEYRNTLVEILTTHQEKLPESMKLKLKPANFSDVLIVPSRYKTKRERVLDKQYKRLKDDIKSEFTIDREREQKFGLVKLDGEPFYGIPIHHTQNMDIEDVSRDVFTNVLYFVDSVNKRQGLQKIEAEMLLLKDLLNTRNIQKTTESGETVYNAFLKNNPQIEKQGGNSARKFNELIDTIFYGRSVVEAGNFFGKFSVNQTVDKLIGLASITQLAFNLPAAAANKINGEVMNISNTLGSRYWSPKDYIKAWGLYDKQYIYASIKDLKNGMPETLESKIMMVFDPIQGSFKDVKGRTISQSALLREFRRDHLFFLNNIGEHSIQVKNMLAMMYGYKLTNSKTGEVSSLADVIEDVKDAKFVLKDGYSISDEEVIRLKNRLHRINQKLHGNYSDSIDRVMLQRYWYGRLALLFRKFVVPGMQRRWDVEHLDFETGEFERGIYLDAWDVFLQEVVNRFKALLTKEALQKPDFDKMSDFEKKVWHRKKAAAYQTLYELGVFLLTILIGNLVIDEDDDEKESWGNYTTALLARRLRGDISFYFNPLEFINMVKNPTVSISYVQSVINFTLSLLFLWGEDAYYDRQVGIFEKGTSKTYAKFLKILPFFRQIVNVQSPEEQLKFYNLLTI